MIHCAHMLKLQVEEEEILGQCVDEKTADAIANICVEVHKSVVRAAKRFWEETRRRHYVTSFTYVEMMRVYSSMLRKRREALELTRWDSVRCFCPITVGIS